MVISALTFSGEQWLWPVLAFVVVASATVWWSYRAAAGMGQWRWMSLALKVGGITALALMGLLPERAQVSGSIRFQGQALTTLDEAGYGALLGNRIGMSEEACSYMAAAPYAWRFQGRPLAAGLVVGAAAIA